MSPFGPGPIIDPVVKKYKHQYNTFMGKTRGDDSLYMRTELLDPLFRPFNYLYPRSAFDANYYLFDEIIPYYTSDPIPGDYDYRYPRTWNHIEIAERLIFRGLLLSRSVDVGDNIRRMYKNNVSCLGNVASAVDVSEANVLGLAYVPSTDRLK